MIKDDDNRFWLMFWFMAATFILGLVFVMGTVINPPEVRKLELQQTYQLKMACIQHGGNWGATYNDNREPYSCKMK